MADLTIQGLAELHKALQDLPVKLEKKILRGALRAGAKVMADAAKSNVPVKSGALRKSIRLSAKTKRGRVTATVKAGNAQAFYAHMVEFGTAAHRIAPKKADALATPAGPRKSIEHPGAKPKPFMRPALDGAAEAAVQAAAEYARGRITKETLAP